MCIIGDYNYGVGFKNTRKFSQIVTKLGAIAGLPPKWVCRGVDLPIRMTNDCIIFLINSVTHDSGWMCFKYK